MVNLKRFECSLGTNSSVVNCHRMSSSLEILQLIFA